MEGEWSVERSLIVKLSETPPMQGLEWAARQTLAKSVLRASLAVPDGVGRVVDGARVLVPDDVMAEGSTLREVSRVLRHAGADEVAGLVLARPRWSPRRETQGRGGPS